MTLYMAVDPGPHTGVAFKLENGRYLTATLEGAGVGRELWQFIKDQHPTKLAFEGFHGSGRMDENRITTIELVGSIRGVCYVLGIPAYRQLAQMRLSFVPDARAILKANGLVSAGHTEHERDALAHLLCLEWRIKTGKLK